MSGRIFSKPGERTASNLLCHRYTGKRAYGHRGVFQGDRVRGFAGKSPHCSGTGERQKAERNS